MLLKIKVRNVLLQLFSRSRQGTNPYKLAPLGNYIYYDMLNLWLPILKQVEKDAAEIAYLIIEFTIHGYSPDDFPDRTKHDENIVNTVKELADEDEIRLLYGVSAGHKYDM